MQQGSSCHKECPVCVKQFITSQTAQYLCKTRFITSQGMLCLCETNSLHHIQCCSCVTQSSSHHNQCCICVKQGSSHHKERYTCVSVNKVHHPISTSPVHWPLHTLLNVWRQGKQKLERQTSFQWSMQSYILTHSMTRKANFPSVKHTKLYSDPLHE